MGYELLVSIDIFINIAFGSILAYELYQIRQILNEINEKNSLIKEPNDDKEDKALLDQKNEEINKTLFIQNNEEKLIANKPKLTVTYSSETSSTNHTNSDNNDSHSIDNKSISSSKTKSVRKLFKSGKKKTNFNPIDLLK